MLDFLNSFFGKIFKIFVGKAKKNPIVEKIAELGQKIMDFIKKIPEMIASPWKTAIELIVAALVKLVLSSMEQALKPIEAVSAIGTMPKQIRQKIEQRKKEKENKEAAKKKKMEKIKKIVQNVKAYAVKAGMILKVIGVVALVIICIAFLFFIFNALSNLFSFSYGFDKTAYYDSDLFEMVQNKELMEENLYEKASETSYYQRFVDAIGEKELEVLTKATLPKYLTDSSGLGQFLNDKTKKEMAKSTYTGFYTMDSRLTIHDANMGSLSDYIQANTVDSALPTSGILQGYMRDFFGKESNFELSDHLLMELNNGAFGSYGEDGEDVKLVYPETFTKPLAFTYDYNRMELIYDSSVESNYVWEEYPYVTKRIQSSDIGKKIGDLDLLPNELGWKNYYAKNNYQVDNETSIDKNTEIKPDWEGRIYSFPSPILWEYAVEEKDAYDIIKIDDDGDITVEDIENEYNSKYLVLFNDDTHEYETMKLYYYMSDVNGKSSEVKTNLGLGDELLEVEGPYVSLANTSSLVNSNKELNQFDIGTAYLTGKLGIYDKNKGVLEPDKIDQAYYYGYTIPDGYRHPDDVIWEEVDGELKLKELDAISEHEEIVYIRVDFNQGPTKHLQLSKIADDKDNVLVPSQQLINYKFYKIKAVTENYRNSQGYIDGWSKFILSDASTDVLSKMSDSNMFDAAWNRLKGVFNNQAGKIESNDKEKNTLHFVTAYPEEAINLSLYLYEKQLCGNKISAFSNGGTPEVIEEDVDVNSTESNGNWQYVYSLRNYFTTDNKNLDEKELYQKYYYIGEAIAHDWEGAGASWGNINDTTTLASAYAYMFPGGSAVATALLFIDASTVDIDGQNISENSIIYREVYDALEQIIENGKESDKAIMNIAISGIDTETDADKDLEGNTVPDGRPDGIEELAHKIISDIYMKIVVNGNAGDDSSTPTGILGQLTESPHIQLFLNYLSNQMTTSYVNLGTPKETVEEKIAGITINNYKTIYDTNRAGEYTIISTLKDDESIRNSVIRYSATTLKVDGTDIGSVIKSSTPSIHTLKFAFKAWNDAAWDTMVNWWNKLTGEDEVQDSSSGYVVPIDGDEHDHYNYQYVVFENDDKSIDRYVEYSSNMWDEEVYRHFKTDDYLLDASSDLPMELRSVRDYGLGSILNYVDSVNVKFKSGVYYDETYLGDAITKEILTIYGDAYRTGTVNKYKESLLSGATYEYDGSLLNVETNYRSDIVDSPERLYNMIYTGYYPKEYKDLGSDRLVELFAQNTKKQFLVNLAENVNNQISALSDAYYELNNGGPNITIKIGNTGATEINSNIYEDKEVVSKVSAGVSGISIDKLANVVIPTNASKYGEFDKVEDQLVVYPYLTEEGQLTGVEKGGFKISFLAKDDTIEKMAKNEIMIQGNEFGYFTPYLNFDDTSDKLSKSAQLLFPMRYYRAWLSEQEVKENDDNLVSILKNFLTKFILKEDGPFETTVNMPSQDIALNFVHNANYGNAFYLAEKNDANWNDFKEYLDKDDTSFKVGDLEIENYPDDDEIDEQKDIWSWMINLKNTYNTKNFKGTYNGIDMINEGDLKKVYLIDEAITFVGKFMYTYKDKLVVLDTTSEDAINKGIIGSYATDRYVFLDSWDVKLLTDKVMDVAVTFFRTDAKVLVEVKKFESGEEAGQNVFIALKDNTNQDGIDEIMKDLINNENFLKNPECVYVVDENNSFDYSENKINENYYEIAPTGGAPRRFAFVYLKDYAYNYGQFLEQTSYNDILPTPETGFVGWLKNFWNNGKNLLKEYVNGELTDAVNYFLDESGINSSMGNINECYAFIVPNTYLDLITRKVYETEDGERITNMFSESQKNMMNARGSGSKNNKDYYDSMLITPGDKTSAVSTGNYTNLLREIVEYTKFFSEGFLLGTGKGDTRVDSTDAGYHKDYELIQDGVYLAKDLSDVTDVYDELTTDFLTYDMSSGEPIGLEFINYIRRLYLESNANVGNPIAWTHRLPGSWGTTGRDWIDENPIYLKDILNNNNVDYNEYEVDILRDIVTGFPLIGIISVAQDKYKSYNLPARQRIISGMNFDGDWTTWGINYKRYDKNVYKKSYSTNLSLSDINNVDDRNLQLSEIWDAHNINIDSSGTHGNTITFTNTIDTPLDFLAKAYTTSYYYFSSNGNQDIDNFVKDLLAIDETNANAINDIVSVLNTYLDKLQFNTSNVKENNQDAWTRGEVNGKISWKELFYGYHIDGTHSTNCNNSGSEQCGECTINKALKNIANFIIHVKTDTNSDDSLKFGETQIKSAICYEIKRLMDVSIITGVIPGPNGENGWLGMIWNGNSEETFLLSEDDKGTGNWGQTPYTFMSMLTAMNNNSLFWDGMTSGKTYMTTSSSGGEVVIPNPTPNPSDFDENTSPVEWVYSIGTKIVRTGTDGTYTWTTYDAEGNVIGTSSENQDSWKWFIDTDASLMYNNGDVLIDWKSDSKFKLNGTDNGSWILTSLNTGAGGSGNTIANILAGNNAFDTSKFFSWNGEVASKVLSQWTIEASPFYVRAEDNDNQNWIENWFTRVNDALQQLHNQLINSLTKFRNRMVNQVNILTEFRINCLKLVGADIDAYNFEEMYQATITATDENATNGLKDLETKFFNQYVTILDVEKIKHFSDSTKNTSWVDYLRYYFETIDEASNGASDTEVETIRQDSEKVVANREDKVGTVEGAKKHVGVCLIECTSYVYTVKVSDEYAMLIDDGRYYSQVSYLEKLEEAGEYEVVYKNTDVNSINKDIYSTTAIATSKDGLNDNSNSTSNSFGELFNIRAKDIISEDFLNAYNKNAKKRSSNPDAWKDITIEQWENIWAPELKVFDSISNEDYNQNSMKEFLYGTYLSSLADNLLEGTMQQVNVGEGIFKLWGNVAEEIEEKWIDKNGNGIKEDDEKQFFFNLFTNNTTDWGKLDDEAHHIHYEDDDGDWTTKEINFKTEYNNGLDSSEIDTSKKKFLWFSWETKYNYNFLNEIFDINSNNVETDDDGNKTINLPSSKDSSGNYNLDTILKGYQIQQTIYDNYNFKCLWPVIGQGTEDRAFNGLDKTTNAEVVLEMEQVRTLQDVYYDIVKEEFDAQAFVNTLNDMYWDTLFAEPSSETNEEGKVISKKGLVWEMFTRVNCTKDSLEADTFYNSVKPYENLFGITGFVLVPRIADRRDEPTTYPLYRNYISSTKEILPEQMETYFRGQTYDSWTNRMTVGEDSSEEDLEYFKNQKNDMYEYFYQYLKNFEAYIPYNIISDSDLEVRGMAGYGDLMVNDYSTPNYTKKYTQYFINEASKDYWKSTRERYGLTKTDLGQLLQGICEVQLEHAGENALNILIYENKDLDEVKERRILLDVPEEGNLSSTNYGNQDYIDALQGVIIRSAQNKLTNADKNDQGRIIVKLGDTEYLVPILGIGAINDLKETEDSSLGSGGSSVSYNFSKYAAIGNSTTSLGCGKFISYSGSAISLGMNVLDSIEDEDYKSLDGFVLYFNSEGDDATGLASLVSSLKAKLTSLNLKDKKILILLHPDNDSNKLEQNLNNRPTIGDDSNVEVLNIVDYFGSEGEFDTSKFGTEFESNLTSALKNIVYKGKEDTTINYLSGSNIKSLAKMKPVGKNINIYCDDLVITKDESDSRLDVETAVAYIGLRFYKQMSTVSSISKGLYSYFYGRDFTNALVTVTADNAENLVLYPEHGTLFNPTADDIKHALDIVYGPEEATGEETKVVETSEAQNWQELPQFENLKDDKALLDKYGVQKIKDVLAFVQDPDAKKAIALNQSKSGTSVSVSYAGQLPGINVPNENACDYVPTIVKEAGEKKGYHFEVGRYYLPPNDFTDKKGDIEVTVEDEIPDIDWTDYTIDLSMRTVTYGIGMGGNIKSFGEETNQYKLVSRAKTDLESGILYIEEDGVKYYLAALGKAFFSETNTVGGKFVVTTAEGNSFYVICSDQMQARHSDSSNMYKGTCYAWECDGQENVWPGWSDTSWNGGSSSAHIECDWANDIRYAGTDDGYLIKYKDDHTAPLNFLSTKYGGVGAGTVMKSCAIEFTVDQRSYVGSNNLPEHLTGDVVSIVPVQLADGAGLDNNGRTYIDEIWEEDYMKYQNSGVEEFIGHMQDGDIRDLVMTTATYRNNNQEVDEYGYTLLDFFNNKPIAEVEDIEWNGSLETNLLANAMTWLGAHYSQGTGYTGKWWRYIAPNGFIYDRHSLGENLVGSGGRKEETTYENNSIKYREGATNPKYIPAKWVTTVLNNQGSDNSANATNKDLADGYYSSSLNDPEGLKPAFDCSSYGSQMYYALGYDIVGDTGGDTCAGIRDSISARYPKNIIKKGDATFKDMQPGDLIVNTAHTMIYMGEYFSNLDGNFDPEDLRIVSGKDVWYTGEEVLEYANTKVLGQEAIIHCGGSGLGNSCVNINTCREGTLTTNNGWIIRIFCNDIYDYKNPDQYNYEFLTRDDINMIVPTIFTSTTLENNPYLVSYIEQSCTQTDTVKTIEEYITAGNFTMDDVVRAKAKINSVTYEEDEEVDY